MTDTQSRFGIMDELNNKKIQAKQALNELEKKKDDYTFQENNKIEGIKRQVEDKEKVYEREFKDWKVQEEMGLRMMQKDFDRQKESHQKIIDDREANYEPDFQDWKSVQESNLNIIEKNLKRFEDQMDTQLIDQKAIIAEYEKSIQDLKEMSQEKA